MSSIAKGTPGRKVVFLSRVLPSDATVGYEDCII